jgi:hypothetical protein
VIFYVFLQSGPKLRFKNYLLWILNNSWKFKLYIGQKDLTLH